MADRKQLAGTYAKAIRNLYPPDEPAPGAPSPATEGASAQRSAISLHMNAEDLVGSAIAMSVPSPMRNRARPSVVVVSVLSRLSAPPIHTHVEKDEPNKHDLEQQHTRSREQEQAPKSGALCEVQRQPQEKEKGACGVVQTEVVDIVPASLPSHAPYTNEEGEIDEDFEKGVGKMETHHKNEGKEHREQMEAKERKGNRKSQPCPIDVQFTLGECVAGKVCKEAGGNLKRKTQEETQDESGSEVQQESAGKLHQKAESPHHDAQQQSGSLQQQVKPETESVQHKTQQEAAAGVVEAVVVEAVVVEAVVVEAVVVEAVNVEASIQKSRLCPTNLKHSPSELVQQALQQAAQPAAQQKEAARVSGALDLLSTSALPVPTEPLCLQVLVVYRMCISSLDCSHLCARSCALWLVRAHPAFSLSRACACSRFLSRGLSCTRSTSRALALSLSLTVSRARARSFSLSFSLSLSLFLSFSLSLSLPLSLSLSLSRPFSLALSLSRFFLSPIRLSLPLSHLLSVCVAYTHTLSLTHT